MNFRISSGLCVRRNGRTGTFSSRNLHEIDGYGRATDLLQGLCHQATFAEPAGRYQDQVILAIKHLLDLFQFVHAVCEEFIFYDCAKFKRIHNRSSAKSYIAKILVAKNFAMTLSEARLPETSPKIFWGEETCRTCE